MSEVVDLGGKPVEGELPAVDTCEAVLETLLADIRAGTVKPIRLVCIVEHEGPTTFFTRSSRMLNSEAIALAAVGSRLFMDGLLGES